MIEYLIRDNFHPTSVLFIGPIINVNLSSSGSENLMLKKTVVAMLFSFVVVPTEEKLLLSLAI